MVMASASASLMTELLHRPATEFGLYFLLFPIGFFTGNFISTRIGNRVSTETMMLAGSAAGLGERVGAGLGAVVAACVTPLAFFIPGTFITMAQGIAMPYAQVGAMAEIPRFAGTAAGVGVFMQNFGAAVFSQLYGIFADGTPRPMIMIAVLCGCLTLVTARDSDAAEEVRNDPAAGVAESFQLDAGPLDDVAVAVGFRLDELAERLRRAERHRGALLHEAVARVRRREHLGRLAVEPGDGLRRVPAGPSMPNQAPTSASMPCSIRVGTSGSIATRCFAATRERPHPAGLDLRQRQRHHVEHHADMAGGEVLRGRRRARYGTCTMSMPACSLSNSAAMWPEAPVPCEA